LLWELPVRETRHIGYQSLVLSVKLSTSAQDGEPPPSRLLTIALMLGLDGAASDRAVPEESSAPAKFLIAFGKQALQGFIDSAGEETR
jgi:hypothetical protein